MFVIIELEDSVNLLPKIFGKQIIEKVIEHLCEKREGKVLGDYIILKIIGLRIVIHKFNIIIWKENLKWGLESYTKTPANVFSPLNFLHLRSNPQSAKF